MFTEMINLMGEMLLLMLVGWAIRATGLLTEEGKKCLTDLLMYVVIPGNIIKAFTSVTLDADLRDSLLAGLIVAILIQVGCSLIGKVIYFMMSPGEKSVYQYSTVCSNAGFMGNALVQAIWGDLGQLYAAIYLIPQRIVIWSAGLTYFTKAPSWRVLVRKVATHPCLIAVYVGLVLMFAQIPLPGMLNNTVSALSACNTALTMIYVGTAFTEVKWAELLSFKQVYFAIVRLIIIPLVVYIPCRMLGLEPMVIRVSTFLAAMPAGATTSLLAAKYGADEATAGKCVILTTTLSIVTLTVWGIVLS